MFHMFHTTPNLVFRHGKFHTTVCTPRETEGEKEFPPRREDRDRGVWHEVVIGVSTLWRRFDHSILFHVWNSLSFRCTYNAYIWRSHKQTIVARSRHCGEALTTQSYGPSQCDQCDNAFKLKDRLNIHRKVKEIVRVGDGNLRFFLWPLCIVQYFSVSMWVENT